MTSFAQRLAALSQPGSVRLALDKAQALRAFHRLAAFARARIAAIIPHNAKRLRTHLIHRMFHLGRHKYLGRRW